MVAGTCGLSIELWPFIHVTSFTVILIVLQDVIYLATYIYVSIIQGAVVGDTLFWDHSIYWEYFLSAFWDDTDLDVGYYYPTDQPLLKRLWPIVNALVTLCLYICILFNALKIGKMKLIMYVGLHARTLSLAPAGSSRCARTLSLAPAGRFRCLCTTSCWLNVAAAVKMP
ncbi:hypothetical protein CYMTET_26935 [Cymbomonas tetramitiformis]|uniref:Uncharacterized protein n=1 Tax=Cymbomonas tetramitiformis TaxID=36881 RepID=A0AAE0FRC5_9CHLO|nr:hypothetical protein CYMTET_26935 [Cymbomonas tetramitiformis]